MPGNRPSRSAAIWHRVRSGALAAIVVIGAFTWSGAQRGWYPFFGDRSRNTNDLGDQFIPMHGYLRDLLTGNAKGDLFINWQSGFGVPFLADYYTYLGSPFALLVLLFPRDEMDAALFVITLAKYVAAAAVMTVYLKRIGTGPWWLQGVLGASYGLCGWAIDDGAYAPMWVDALLFLPLLCLAAEWRFESRRFIPTVLIVSYGWLANFYVGFMATLAAGLIVAVRLIVQHTNTKDTLRALIRVAAPVACGIGLLLPLLVPTFMATRTGQPGFSYEVQSRPVTELLSRLLPASQGVGATASIYIGSVALLLVCALPFHSGVPKKIRIVWTALPLLVGLSLRWTPTAAVWHFFDRPDGSRYRMAFVLCAMLVIAAWHAVAFGLPRLKALAAGAVVITVLGFVAKESPLISDFSVILLLGAVLVAAVALLAAHGQNRAIAVAAAVACIAVFFAEETLTAVFVDERRSRNFTPTLAWSAAHDERRALVAGAGDFPGHRTDPGAPPLVLNDPMLVGGEGSGYYSSLIPAVTFQTLADLGYPNQIRVVMPADNPVLDTIFSVGARVKLDGNQLGIVTRAVPPLVTTRAQVWQPPRAESPFYRQEAMLGETVYRYPEFTVVESVPVNEQVLTRIRLSCGSEQQVYAWTPGGLQTAGGIQNLGLATGVSAEFTLKTPLPVTLTQGSVACLDPQRLTAVNTRLIAEGAMAVRAQGHVVEADLLPRSGESVAVLAVTNAPGWTCASGSGPAATPRDFGGLISVPMAPGDSRVRCSFEPPGIRLGLAGGVFALVATIALAWFYRRRIVSQP